MLKTIIIGNHLSIQGTLVEMLTDSIGKVRVGSRIYTGRVVTA